MYLGGALDIALHARKRIMIVRGLNQKLSSKTSRGGGNRDFEAFFPPPLLARVICFHNGNFLNVNYVSSFFFELPLPLFCFFAFDRFFKSSRTLARIFFDFDFKIYLFLTSLFYNR